MLRIDVTYCSHDSFIGSRAAPRPSFALSTKARFISFASLKSDDNNYISNNNNKENKPLLAVRLYIRHLFCAWNPLSEFPQFSSHNRSFFFFFCLEFILSTVSVPLEQRSLCRPFSLSGHCGQFVPRFHCVHFDDAQTRLFYIFFIKLFGWCLIICAFLQMLVFLPHFIYIKKEAKGENFIRVCFVFL